ncbi:UDP-N-acetylglucosamine 1-carboxyvinyltransferase [Stratiformator vulcanicus]|uniref:UDP-N-acetylglucosamine 1-carboxyvinyltransferase n=1 Tax=Stratiformator vulcanicus TaxID=2527980 RepID=A0A517QZY2_9PLAN|nr:UDP-N-acetylglucosamine 1-carboxyvinyltransferase [Stratiformator vulcanicus]QDT37207.1 UDP-N-acetylglucosamine 1-carboxyvinyltransferase MurA [Stratiformator vulcanicus]
MDAFEICGGRRLAGEVAVSGSKNAALAMLAAALLTDEPVRLNSVPFVSDVTRLLEILERLGVAVDRYSKDAVTLDAGGLNSSDADCPQSRMMRASICLLGPLLVRTGRAIIPLPGGCAIGTRPIDLHLRGLSALGVRFEVGDGLIVGKVQRLRGADIDLSGPCGGTVTGTCNVMMAATAAPGTTVIRSAAPEPEVRFLAEALQQMGADIEGAGTQIIRINGGRKLHGAVCDLIPDRIEAATLTIAAAMVGDDVLIRNAPLEDLEAVIDVLTRTGASITPTGSDAIRITRSTRLANVDLVADHFPAIPTDVQAQLTAYLCLATGRSTIVDRVFPERFAHVAQLRRLGANIEAALGRAEVNGVSRLHGATVRATDLRASAALVLAGLAAEGTTTVTDIAHLDRGYVSLDQKLSDLGATVRRCSDSAEPVARALRVDKSRPSVTTPATAVAESIVDMPRRVAAPAD